MDDNQTITLQIVFTCDRCDRRFRGSSYEAMNRAGWDAPVFTVQGNVSTQGQLCPRHARWWTFRYWARRFQWRIGRVSQWLSPSYGWCFRCLTTWNYVHGHTTMYRNGQGCFPLCEKCWSELEPIDRLPFYRQLYERWIEQGCTDYDWEEIEIAVIIE